MPWEQRDRWKSRLGSVLALAALWTYSDIPKNGIWKSTFKLQDHLKSWNLQSVPTARDLRRSASRTIWQLVFFDACQKGTPELQANQCPPSARDNMQSYVSHPLKETSGCDLDCWLLDRIFQVDNLCIIPRPTVP